MRMARVRALSLVAIFLPGSLAAAPAAAPPASEALTSSLLKTPSGGVLHYVVQGDPKGPVVVLVHGIGDSWELVLPLLPKSFRCLVGHSLGSFAAQEVATGPAGTRVGRLVLVGSGPALRPVEQLRDVKAKALLVWGDKDALLTRADQEALVAGIRGSRLVVYPATGRAAQWEEPERFARDLVAFLRKLEKLQELGPLPVARIERTCRVETTS